MATNFGVRIDALKFKNAFMRNVTSPKTGVTKRCLVISVDDNPNIHLGEKGCYMNFTAVEVQNPKYDDTHLIKGNVPKEVYEQMSDEERMAQPIFGNMAPIKSREMNVSGTATFDESDEDLPF